MNLVERDVGVAEADYLALLGFGEIEESHQSEFDIFGMAVDYEYIARRCWYLAEESFTAAVAVARH